MRNAIAHEESIRGRMTNALKAAEELVEVGRRMNDPRSLGYGIAQQAPGNCQSNGGPRARKSDTLSSLRTPTRQGSATPRMRSSIYACRPSIAPETAAHTGPLNAEARLWDLAVLCAPLTPTCPSSARMRY
jgi:hypothetical protein